MSEKKYFILYGIIISIIIAFGIWYTTEQWKECREMGFSKFYCWKHIN